MSVIEQKELTNITENIWKEFHLKLLAFISGRVSDKSIADDILQEVFIKIHSKIDSLKNRSQLKSWIYQITRNAIIDYYRADEKIEELPELLPDSDSDLNQNNRLAFENCISPLIQNLPDIYSQALVLSEIEGLKQKDVAKKLGISLSATKARIQRGRLLAKDTILQCCHFEFDHNKNIVDYKPKDPSCNQC